MYAINILGQVNQDNLVAVIDIVAANVSIKQMMT